jgi:UDP-2,3-diacylglucosamine pyrophosphatase LpxH
MTRIVLLSDLHMGARERYEQFRADDALAATLESFAGDPTVSALVLLGDTFDVAGEGDRPHARQPAVSRLLDVLGAHRDVVRALASLVRRGVRLHVVLGNHDVHLAAVSVQAALARALAVEDAAAVQFHPWLHHVPGLFLAEHGHQHHDVNAFDTPVTPLSDDDGVTHEPFGYQLPLLRHRHGPTLPARAAGAALHEAVRLCGPVRRTRRRAYRREVLPRYAAEVALSEGHLLRLDDVGRRNPAAILARLVRETTRSTGPGYLVDAAYGAREALGDDSPPFLVMGHSHAADARPLRSDRYGRPVVYLNTGTWSVSGPRPRDTTLRPVTMTWVEIEAPRGLIPARARVLHAAADGGRTVLAEADATGIVVRDTAAP